ncbi:MAG: Eco57I restriction-modification methylase domain-containing protein [Terriglobia bacterium]|jgi:adenine-specific DNA-methyltransferase
MDCPSVAKVASIETPSRTASTLLDKVEELRTSVARRLNPSRRVDLGQFLTPAPVARFMASLCKAHRQSIRLLDAGAGVGSLTAAVVAEICAREHRPAKLQVCAYEIDNTLIEGLRQTLALCRNHCNNVGIQFEGHIEPVDFIQAAVGSVCAPLFEESGRFDMAILNPPYRKINSDSDIRRVLGSAGIETSNLYTAFLSLVVRMLAGGGELVAITPRSFCNGPYFRPFRQDFLSRMAFERLHVFDSRDALFGDDDVLQENIIFRAIRRPAPVDGVTLSTSSRMSDTSPTLRRVNPEELVHPGDPEIFIHIVPDELNDRIAKCMAALQGTLTDLGLSVSTGRVVDFRARHYLRSYPQDNCAPLIHPCHMKDGVISWPRLNGKKPNAIAIVSETLDALIPRGVYVVTKRFSAKEEPRRIVAALYDPSVIAEPLVGFENHLNYYHCEGSGLSIELARGLVAYLNSTFVDTYFRQFNGHTQVNATDLRTLHYPRVDQLQQLGRKLGSFLANHKLLDHFVEEMISA